MRRQDFSLFEEGGEMPELEPHERDSRVHVGLVKCVCCT